MEEGGALPEREALEVARRLSESFVEAARFPEVDLADVAGSPGSAGLQDEVEVSLAAVVAELEIPPNS
ncbi:MAG: hypothetical protein ACREDE_09550 [Thermoplasmata archaeon]